MNLTLNLPADLETELTIEASQLGIPLSEHVLSILLEKRTRHESPGTGAELLAYWQEAGLIGTRMDIVNATEHARSLREQAQSRAKA